MAPLLAEGFPAWEAQEAVAAVYLRIWARSLSLARHRRSLLQNLVRELVRGSVYDLGKGLEHGLELELELG
jgi:hypothetical protein